MKTATIWEIELSFNNGVTLADRLVVKAETISDAIEKAKKAAESTYAGEDISVIQAKHLSSSFIG